MDGIRERKGEKNEKQNNRRFGWKGGIYKGRYIGVAKKEIETEATIEKGWKVKKKIEQIPARSSM